MTIVEATDAASGKTYYYDTVLRKTSWVRDELVQAHECREAAEEEKSQSHSNPEEASLDSVYRNDRKRDSLAFQNPLWRTKEHGKNRSRRSILKKTIRTNDRLQREFEMQANPGAVANSSNDESGFNLTADTSKRDKKGKPFCLAVCYPPFMSFAPDHAAGFRDFVRKAVLSNWFQCWIVVVTISDGVVCIVDLVTRSTSTFTVWVTIGTIRTTFTFLYLLTNICYSVVALFFYTLEIVMKMYGCGFRAFIRDPWNWFDTLVVMIAFVFMEDSGGRNAMLGRQTKLVKNIRFLRQASRAARVLRICRGAAKNSGKLSQVAKNAVSKSKKRFVDVDNNFDLDLTYITPQLIAMGVPAKDFLVALYRNPLSEVSRFFNTRHGGRYRIYNCCPEVKPVASRMCSERRLKSLSTQMPYPEKPFYGQVVPFDIQVTGHYIFLFHSSLPSI